MSVKFIESPFNLLIVPFILLKSEPFSPNYQMVFFSLFQLSDLFLFTFFRLETLKSPTPRYTKVLVTPEFFLSFIFRSVTSLKNQMEKERKNHKQEYFRKLRENAFLLEEIAELKKELTEAKKYRLPSVDMDAGSMMYKQRNSSMFSPSMSSGSSRGSER